LLIEIYPDGWATPFNGHFVFFFAIGLKLKKSVHV
jgi:hypothetical protein